MIAKQAKVLLILQNIFSTLSIENLFNCRDLKPSNGVSSAIQADPVQKIKFLNRKKIISIFSLKIVFILKNMDSKEN